MKRNWLTVYQRSTISNPSSRPITFPIGRPKTTSPGLRGIVYWLSALPQDLGWVEYVHPEGKPYFRHPKNKVVTESDITESLTRKKIEYVSKALFRELIDSEVELYLVLDQHCQDTYHYYFADHTTQRVFWPEGVDPLRHNLVPPELKGTPYGEFPSRSAHYPPNVVYTDLFIAWDYYRHLEFFPCHNELPTNASSFLYDVLVFTCTGKRKSYVCSRVSILLTVRDKTFTMYLYS